MFLRNVATYLYVHIELQARRSTSVIEKSYYNEQKLWQSSMLVTEFKPATSASLMSETVCLYRSVQLHFIADKIDLFRLQEVHDIVVHSSTK
jgi:hypothetical protein